MDIFEKDKEYLANTYSRFPLHITKGCGSVAYDADGCKYIDMGAGIAVNTFGYCDPRWVEAINAQLTKLTHTSNLYYTSPCVELAEALCLRTGMKKVFFSNSGAEANECAIKAARKYAQDKKGKEYSTIITLNKSFHGRTITTLAATGQQAFHNDFLPLTEGFEYAEPNIQDVSRLVDGHNVAAIMFEPVQGEGGVIPLDKAFVLQLAKLAADRDILLIADEVQTGNGRTGRLYAYMHYGIMPDIVTTAKGLGGGLPLGATMLGEKVSGVFTPGTHGSTFGGNPICCAGAISVLSALDDDFLNSVTAKSQYIINELNGAEGVISVSGLGLMLGVETNKPAKQVVAECMDKGVLLLTAKDRVRLLPALNIPDRLLAEAISVIKEVCAGGDE